MHDADDFGTSEPMEIEALVFFSLDVLIVGKYLTGRR